MRTDNIEFDTHSIIKRLIHTGLKEATAEEIVHALNKSRQFDISNLATKADIANIKHIVATIKQDMANIKETMATKADIEKSKNESIKWQIGTFIALASIIIACFKFFIH